MATCWNSFQCCLMLRNATSESSGGVAGSRLKRMKHAGRWHIPTVKNALKDRLARYRQISLIGRKFDARCHSRSSKDEHGVVLNNFFRIIPSSQYC